ncbi:MAG: class I SAM-dependent methyltransferase [Bacillota bacterium]|nr:class I SAM-dependent methyltransferase [Bacillota bacterium]
MENKNWSVWDREKAYGEIFYKRASGILPEMESSKRMALEVKNVIKPDDKILDVGCGAGHYLRSLKREIKEDFRYVGIDKTSYYIELAKRAYGMDCRAQFAVSDVFSIDFEENTFDIVMCNNLLLHLPSIEKPLSEIIRVAKRKVLIRFLCGERSFRIKDINPESEAYDENGEPFEFSYLNIYSASYIESLIRSQKKALRWEIEPDIAFDRQGILNSVDEHKKAYNSTKIIGDFQVNGYVLLPWTILKIDL